MRTTGTDIDWPLDPSGRIILNCGINLSDPQYMAKMKAWPTTAKKTFDAIVDEYAAEKVNVPRQVWKEVRIT